MISRIAAVFGSKCAEKITAGTFHAVSYKWLKQLGQKVLLKQPAELKMLFKTVYDKYAAHGGQLLTAQALYDYFSLWENRADESFALYLESRNAAHKAHGELYSAMFDEFNALKKELGFVGYNDLLILVRDQLKAGAKNPFFEVLVDEFQDTNPLQNSLIEAINPPSLFCVGDYDQSIYAFNGAEIGIIAGFDQRYADAQVWTLSKNYRSSAHILSLANRVIAHNKRIYPKSLEVVKTAAAPEPKLLAFGELFEQYRAIAQMISISSYRKTEIAVIFRNNSSADGIEGMLKELGIAAKRKGSRSFFDSGEVKVLLDLMTIVLMPRDLLAFIHVLEYAPKIGASTAKELYDAAITLCEGSLLRGIREPKSPEKPLFGKTHLGLFGYEESGAVRKNGDRFGSLPAQFAAHPLLAHPQLGEESAKFLLAFWQLLGDLDSRQPPSKQLAAATSSPLFEMIAVALAKKRAKKRDQPLDDALVLEAKERVYTKARTLGELSKHYGESERFLNAMVLGAGEMSEGSGVNLLSVHASKGLEFDEVFVIDLMDGRFPNRKLMSQAGNIEEERRLFYVAATRARESLILSFASFDKYKKINYTPSQFLYEAGMIGK